MVDIPVSIDLPIDSLDDQDDDVEPIDYDRVSHYAKEGLKNPRMIAHLMGLPVDWFIDTYKEKVDIAIERGIAAVVMESILQMRKNAAIGDFQAQKYILQNMDDTWADRKETINKNEIDIKGLPSLQELFKKGLENIPVEKEVNVIEGEVVVIKEEKDNE